MLENDPEANNLGDSFDQWLASLHGPHDHEYPHEYSTADDLLRDRLREQRLPNPMDRVIHGPKLAQVCHWCQLHPVAPDTQLALHPDFGMLCLSCRAALAAFVDRLAEHRGWRHARAADALFGLLDLAHVRI